MSHSLVVHTAAVMLFLSSSAAVAAGYSNGSVLAQGSIIAETCAIDVDSSDQTIRMPTLSVGDMIRLGEGPLTPFAIRLINCYSNAPSHYRVTFDGDVDGDNFDLTGQAAGVALQLADSQGNIAQPGKAMPVIGLGADDVSLEYTLRLVGNTQALRAGDYRALVRFSMDYF